MTTKPATRSLIVAGLFLASVGAAGISGCGAGKPDTAPASVTHATDPVLLRQATSDEAHTATDVPESGTSAASGAVSSSQPAIDFLADLRKRFARAEDSQHEGESVREVTSLLSPGNADRFHPEAGGLRAHFGASVGVQSARVLFPRQSTAPLHIEDVTTGASADVVLVGAREADAQVADGYLIYPNAHASGATLLHRALPAGVEDFLSFEKRPRAPVVAYKVSLGEGIQGLRLVANSLELLDVGGAPRLRVAPPFLLGADGARTDAVLALAGCAVDKSGAGPWGRDVKPPGSTTCTLRVSWDDKAVEYPAVLDPRWTTTTGSMVSARQGHTATLLSTGKVLVAGGRTSGTSTTGLATAELFDRTTGTWAATGSMTGGRWFHSAVQLNASSNTTTSGKVLIAGGINGTTSQNTAQLYSPTAGTWVGAPNLNTARHQHTATLLANGQVLVAGGLAGTAVLNSAALYNPASGVVAWTATGTMASARKSHSATLLVVPGNATLNNKVLVVGGNSGTASLTSVQLFDGTTWSTPTGIALTTAREGHTATALANGNVLITGGKNGSTTLATAFLFDAASGSGTWSTAGTMTSVRQTHKATLLPTGIVAGGQVLVTGGSNGTSSLGTAELWNGTSIWTATTALPAAIQDHTATLLSNSAVLIAGGANGTTTVNTARLYDPSSGLACTSNSQCTTGFCASGVCCDAACTNSCSSCNLTGLVGTCSPKPNGASCNDSNACTTGETCQAGLCGGGTVKTCAASDQCHIAGTCDPVSGTCSKPAASNGTSCSDDNACTQTDTCQNGICASGTLKTCAASDQCHAPGTCNQTTGACSMGVALPDATPCNDGNTCTQSDTCRSGSCQSGQPVACTGSSNHSSLTIGPGGGTVALEHATLQVPAGALSATKTITITSSLKTPPAGTLAYTPIFDFSPDGTQFSTPVMVTFNIGLGAVNPVIIWSRPGGGYDDIGGTYANGQISAPVTHFSSGGVIQSQCQGKPEGTLCTDGNGCTSDLTSWANSNDTCRAGTCVPGAQVNCDNANVCRQAGVCNPATGLCPLTQPMADGTGCNDGNSCTIGDRCVAGTCLPGETSICTDSGRPIYPPITDLGSTQGASFARDINENGVVIGTDTRSDYAQIYLGAIDAQGFRWTASGGRIDLPHESGTFPMSINSSGVIAGTAISGLNNWQQPFRHAQNETSVRLLTAGGRGNGINDAGTITGLAYSSTGHGMYRSLGLGEPPEELPGPTGSLTQGWAIDPSGNVYGNASLVGGGYFAVRYHNSRGFEVLNDLLPSGSDWDLKEAYATNGNQFVGWGYRGNGAGRAFRVTLNQDGGFAEIKDLGIPAPYEPDTTGPVVVAHDINVDGVVVGSVYDHGPVWPGRAFIWLDGTIYDLNDFLDPLCGWTLNAAFGINNKREVVGYGVFNKRVRAFVIQFPHITNPATCPPANDCKVVEPFNPLTGTCLSTTIREGQSCSACNNHGICQAGNCRCQATISPQLACVLNFPATRQTAIFDYINSESKDLNVPVGPDNQVSIAGSVAGNLGTAQPVWFGPGHQYGALTVQYDSGPVSWSLAGHTATSSSSSPSCSLVDNAQGLFADLGGGHLVLLESHPAAMGNAISPVLDCVAANPGGTFSAHFGYVNSSGSQVLLPIGPNNHFSGSTAGLGQVTTFPPGSYSNTFIVQFDGSPLSWTLGSHTVSASSSDKPCVALDCAP